MKMTEKGISQRVGEFDFGGGNRGAIYQALKPLVCSKCGSVIAEDELFTRRRVQNLPLLALCRGCRPLKFRSDRAHSALLRSVLTAQSAAAVQQSSGEDTTTEDRAATQQDRLAEEMEQRLGPALERCRRRRFRG